VTKPVDFDTLDADIRRVVSGRPPRAMQGSLLGDDLAHRLLQRLGGDVDLIGQLCELFVTEQPRLVHALDEAIAAGDAGQVADAAHRYKGVLLNLGADEAGTVAGELEQLARTGSMAALGPQARELHACVVAFLPRLQNVAAELHR
jgi:HPt (histidine-containing phosphotransfer) domain-containing protein